MDVEIAFFAYNWKPPAYNGAFYLQLCLEELFYFGRQKPQTPFVPLNSP